MTLPRLLELLGTKWRMIPVLIVLAAIWIYFGQQNELFLSSRNLSNLAGQIVVTSLVALGLLFVLVIGEIDLSVAASSAVSAAVTAKLALTFGYDPSVAIALGILTGMLIGGLTGLVVTLFRAPSFIVTLGISLILQGLLLRLLPPESNLFSLVQSPIAGIATTYLSPGAGWALAAAATAIYAALRLHHHVTMRGASLSSGWARDVLAPTALAAAPAFAAVAVFNSYRGLPFSVALLMGLLGLFAYVTTQTRFGLYLYAIGANAEAARRAGIPVTPVRIAAFMLSGALVAIGGIVAAARVMGVSPDSADPTLLLEAIAAAVIGGVSLFGGRGSVWSALIGALVIGSVSNGLLLVNASTETRLQVQGLILIVAVVIDALLARSSTRR
jgi:D-xylose transport system permease protein